MAKVLKYQSDLRKMYPCHCKKELDHIAAYAKQRFPVDVDGYILRHSRRIDFARLDGYVDGLAEANMWADVDADAEGEAE